jgi:hypothetical protein
MSHEIQAIPSLILLFLEYLEFWDQEPSSEKSAQADGNDQAVRIEKKSCSSATSSTHMFSIHHICPGLNFGPNSVTH